MARALVILAGLVLGILAGASLVVANPLAWFRGLPPLAADLAPAKTYRWDDYRGFEVNVASLLGVRRRDRTVALMDPALPHVRLGIVVLPAGEGTPAALGIKVAAIAGENAIWRAELGTHDYWVVAWPGEGSLFANAYSNYWSLARDSFFASLLGGGPERLAPSYPLTAPLPGGGVAAVTGASGRYAGFTGEIRETLYLPHSDSGRTAPDWAIAIKANPPPVAPR